MEMETQWFIIAAIVVAAIVVLTARLILSDDGEEDEVGALASAVEGASTADTASRRGGAPAEVREAFTRARDFLVRFINRRTQAPQPLPQPPVAPAQPTVATGQHHRVDVNVNVNVTAPPGSDVRGQQQGGNP